MELGGLCQFCSASRMISSQLCSEPTDRASHWLPAFSREKGRSNIAVAPSGSSTVDCNKLLEYIALAEQAIRAHASTQPLSVRHSPDEQPAMEDALHALNLLRRSVLRE